MKITKGDKLTLGGALILLGGVVVAVAATNAVINKYPTSAGRILNYK